MSVLYTSVVDEHISIKSISEKNYILLVFEIYVSPCEEVRVKAEWTKYSCQVKLLESLVAFLR